MFLNKCYSEPANYSVTVVVGFRKMGEWGALVTKDSWKMEAENKYIKKKLIWA